MTIKNYWDGTGLHQELANKLNEMIPHEGPVKGKKNQAIEKFRKASNAYYDIFNNGGGNRTTSIRRIFGIRISDYTQRDMRGYRFIHFDRIHRDIEWRMDEIVMAAAKEQGLAKQ